jgi:hypothetical protein
VWLEAVINSFLTGIGAYIYYNEPKPLTFAVLIFLAIWTITTTIALSGKK